MRAWSKRWRPTGAAGRGPRSAAGASPRAQPPAPLNGRCRQGPTLDGVSTLAFSPDGRDVLAITPPHDALVQLRRDDEGVTRIQCFSATGTSGGCTRIPRLNGVNALALS